MNGRERVAFLVGAGLVKDAGLPTSIELADRLKEDLRAGEIDEQKSDAERKVAGRFLALLRFLSGGIRFQEGFLNRDPDAPVNIEQIAFAALSLGGRLQNPLAPYSSGWHQRLLDLESDDPRLTDEFLEFIYSRLNSWLTQNDIATIAYLARIADVVSERRGVDIFSLNYDLCIETALSETRRDLVNGFTDAGWRPELFGADADVRLFKLHGSLDWIKDDSYGVCALTNPRHRDAEDIEGTHRPLLIFGTNQKLSARQPFLTLTYHFSQATLRSRVLVVIGYSFADAHVNEIVEQAFRSNSSLRIIVVAPQASALVETQQILVRSPRVSAINMYAKNALNDGYVQRAVDSVIAESAEDKIFD